MQRHASICAALALAAVAATGLHVCAQGFSVEQVLTSPFPEGLTAAEHGSRVAWVFADRGAQTVWVAAGPAFTPRQVTHYEGDSGQPIASLRLTPDGRTAVYARGTELNAQGRSANPLSGARQPKQQVWAVDADAPGAQPRLLGDMGCEFEGCEDVQVSPDGQWAVWETKHQLWIASLTASGTPVRQLTDIRGSLGGPRWSPDGAHLVATVDRGDHTLTAVLDVSSGSLQQVHYIAPSTDRDLSPRWSPDGAHIAFLRIGGVEERKPLIPQPITPYSVWVADAHTFAAHPIWRSGAGPRGSMPPFAPDQLFFAAGDRVVFSSEADGRNHLYSVSTSGGAAALLTPGEFDVEEATLSPDKRTVLASTNQDDVDRRHIWSVPVAGGSAPKALSHGDTLEWAPVFTGDGRDVICLGATAVTPPMVYRLDDGHRTLITKDALPKNFPSAQLVVPKQVTFTSADGLTIHGQLFQPKNQTKPGPGIIFTHGGPQRQMMLGFHSLDFYSYSYAENEYLASRGYTVLSVNYRLGIMYGREFREAPHSSWRGAAEYADVLAGARYLQSLPTVDPKRIGLWGGSYGGFLTAMGLARNSDVFVAGVDYAGVHDWVRDNSTWDAAPDLAEAKALATSSSPNASISTWKSPVLVVAGDDDRNVAFNQSVTLVQKLRAQGVDVDQIVYPDEVHDILLWRNILNFFNATNTFFDQHLHP